MIQHAIVHEEREEQFYEQLADRVEGNDLKAALLEHAAEEQEHKRHLQRILENHRLPASGRAYPDPDMKLADYAVVEADANAPLDYEEVLLLAAKREKQAQRLYLDLASQATDPQLKETLTFLAQQEGRHAARLEQEFDDTLSEG